MMLSTSETRLSQLTHEVLGYHETSVRVRFGQVDSYTMLWHGHVLSFFEVARADLARSFELSARDLQEVDVAIPMIELACQYKNPAYEDDLLTVQSTLLKPSLPIPEFAFRYRLLRAADAKEIARGSTRQVLVRRSGRLIIRLPEGLQERLQLVWDYLAKRPVWID
jgi:acyl-CoA thioester hydrolase